MNEELRYNLPEKSQMPAEPPSEFEADTDMELLGALDIVEAFTALRHELKLQVRNGKELQQSLGESLRSIDQRLAIRERRGDGNASSDDGRGLAEALAETEESLHRAVEMLGQPSRASDREANLLEQFDRAVEGASWLARKFAGGLLARVRGIVERALRDVDESQAMSETTQQGLELLLTRVHRLMGQCEIERVDVLGEPFDADLMNALEVIDAPSMASSHVAEQLRPAYRWRGKILRCADVRIAR
jgi:molecular chaperone GrpE